MRIFYFLSRLLLCVIIFGCATTSLKQVLPPHAYAPPAGIPDTSEAYQQWHDQLEKSLAANSGLPMKWWVRYNQARLAKEVDSGMACRYFRELSEEAEFPLHEIALIRAYQTCHGGDADLQPLDIERLKKKTWLKDTVTEVSLNLAKAGNDLETAMEIYVQKSKTSVIFPEKITLMKKAIELAEKAGRPDRVEEYTRRLYHLSPSLQPKQSREQRLSVAYDLRRNRNFKAARKIYHQVIADRRSGEKEILESLHGIRTSYKLERKTKEYIRATQNISQYAYRLFQKHRKHRRSQADYARLYRDSVLLYVRTLWTDGKVSRSVNLLQALAGDLNGLASAEQIYWLRGRIDEEAKNYRHALRWFDAALDECRQNCSISKNLQWYKAWVLNKMNRHAEAAEVLSHLAGIGDEGEHPKYLFWWGKQLALTGRQLEARGKFAQLIQEDPLGYYGLLAHRELKIPLSSPAADRQIASTSDDPPIGNGSFLLSPQGTFVSWMISVGENQLAENYLDQQASILRQRQVYRLETWREVFSLYARTQSYLGLLQNLHRLPADVRKELLAQQPQMIFPQPYQQAVSQAAQRFGVSPELIYSIMRQESAFNHQARSPADAFGLMQLLPSVAKRTAASANVPFENHADLYHPETNIALGSALLKELWDRYNGQFVIMAASYNASEKAIRNWIKHRFEGDPLQFIEDIPYSETRNYIKLVLRNLIVYQQLNAGGEAIEFPEWCLQNIQDVNI